MVSFIIIGKNEGQRLINSIKSVHRFAKEEHITDYEIIYVDSQSSDQSITNAFASGSDKVFVIKGKCNAAIGRNCGAKEAKGDILFFLDGDMELIPGFWKSITDANGNLIYPFVSGVENDVLYDNCWNYVTTKCRRKYIKGQDSYDITTGGLFCISRNYWERIGGFDCRLKMNEDLDIGVRLSRIGCPLCRKPDLWVNHHTRFYGSRNESENGIEYTAVFIRKHLFEPKTQIQMLFSTYSYWLLIICIVWALYTSLWIPLTLYLIVVGYRALRIIQRTKVKLNPIVIYVRRIKKDFKFWWHFVTFWPQSVQLNYSQVQKNE